ncbi:hypothetical protein [Aneurinibacillus sp. REN35]|uniref:hypothetical protein n=1 Tax=Aneurinibacillus sp. REN35 TaxID=3237286 RepID=UPI003529991F
METEPLKNDEEGKFGSYSLAINTKQKFVIIPNKKNKVSIIGVGTYFSGELTDKTIEEAIKGAKIVASALGVGGDDINKKISELLISQYGFEKIGDILMAAHITTVKSSNQKSLVFLIATDAKSDDL